MISEDDSIFPNNVVELCAIAFQVIDTDLQIFKRPLRPTDPVQAIGVFSSLWEPEEDSFEMGHQTPGEPTLSRYQIGAQGLVKDSDEVRGLATHSVLSKRMRGVLYGYQPLRVALAQLSVTLDGSTERLTRWGIRTQRYMNNDVEGSFVYLSTLDYWIETETS
jgi:hypothetical protein